MDILRRFDFADFTTGLDLDLDKPDEVLFRGLFQRGFFKKSGNALHRIAEAVHKNAHLKKQLRNFAGPIARKMLEKIPGGTMIADAVKHVLDHNDNNYNNPNAQGTNPDAIDYSQ